VRFPLLLPAIALLAGAALPPGAVPAWLLIVAAASLLLAGWVCQALRMSSFAAAAAALSLFPAGALDRASFERRFDAHLLPPALLERASDEDADVTGTLIRLPRSLRDKDQIDVDVDSVRVGGVNIGLAFHARITVRRSEIGASLPDLLPGDRIECAARFFPTRGFRNPGAFDATASLKADSIHHRGYVKSPLLVRKTSTGSWGLRRAAGWLRREFSRRLRQSVPDEESGALAAALILGERDRLSEELEESMRRSGLYHLLAISGGNFAVFAWLVFMALRLVRLPERPTLVVVFVVTLFYAAMVEFESSVVRAFLMIVVYLAGRFLERDHQLLNAFASALIASVVVEPAVVDDYGFQLTFLATALLIVFAPRIASVGMKNERPGWLRNVIGINIAAGLGLAPYLAYHFNRVTFGGILLNFLAIPLSGLILALGLCTFLASCAGLGFAFGPMLGWAASAFAALSHGVPFPSILSYRVAAPAAWLVWCFYLLLASWPFLPGLRRAVRVAHHSLIVPLFLLSMAWPFEPRPSHLRLTFIDVGQGDSTLVEFPEGKRMLVDGGGHYEDTFDYGANVVAPYLFRKGIDRLDWVVATHAHPDHINGLRYIVQNLSIGEVWEGSEPTQSRFHDQFRRSIPSGTPVRLVRTGDHVVVGSVVIDVLNPPAKEPPTVASNDDSVVLRLVYGRATALLTGDIEEGAMTKMLHAGIGLRATALKCPHHGSRSSAPPPFIEAVAPAVVVISVGSRNRWGLPDPEVLRAYRDCGAAVFRTDEDGAVSIELHPDGSWHRVGP